GVVDDGVGAPRAARQRIRRLRYRRRGRRHARASGGAVVGQPRGGGQALMAREDFDIVDQKPIGRGQFGTVFRARRRSDGRTVALKLILHDGDTGGGTIAAERHGAILQQEFASRYGMVAEVFEFGPDGDDLYIAMEHVEGPSLEERLRDGALPYDEAVGHALWLCDFLDRAHAFSVTVEHRPY